MPGLLVGGDDDLVKPFAPGELLARIRSLVRRSRERALGGLTEREKEVLRLLGEVCTERRSRSDSSEHERGTADLHDIVSKVAA